MYSGVFVMPCLRFELPSFFMHPQDLATPDRKAFNLTSTVFPQSQMQAQRMCFLLGLTSCPFGLRAVSLPNFMPVILSFDTMIK
jgi:hypothetical protein